MIQDLENMTIENLKDFLEQKTPYKFNIRPSWNNEPELYMTGLNKEHEITLHFGRFDSSWENGARYVSIDYNYKLNSGCIPCRNLEKVIKYIDEVYEYLGYQKPKHQQLSLFD